MNPDFSPLSKSAHFQNNQATSHMALFMNIIWAQSHLVPVYWVTQSQLWKRLLTFCLCTPQDTTVLGKQRRMPGPPSLPQRPLNLYFWLNLNREIRDHQLVPNKIKTLTVIMPLAITFTLATVPPVESSFLSTKITFLPIYEKKLSLRKEKWFALESPSAISSNTKSSTHISSF